MTSPTSITGWNATAGSTTTDPLQEHIDAVAKNRTLNRQIYYHENYDVMTGLRIAATLGGFFILVLLTLLYKSKCKRHSRCPSDVSMNIGGVGRSSVLINPLTISGENAEYYDGMILGKEDYFCHYAAAGDTEPRNHLNAIPFTKPQLRLTPAHSESSEDGLCGGRYELSSSREDCHGDEEYFAGLDSAGKFFRRSSSCLQNGKTLLSARTFSGPLGGSSEEAEEGKGRMKWLKQSIDINVILPTPTISPSSSETFTRLPRKNNNELLFYGRRDDAVRRDNSSFDDGSVNESESEMSALVPLSSSSALCYLDNLKYMDDTSSENIPTRGSDYDDQDNDSRRSIRSDSIFTCYDSEYGPEVSLRPPPPPPPPPVPQQTPPLPPKPSKSKFRRIFGSTPPYHLGIRRQSGSSSSNHGNGGATSVLLGNDEEEDCECRMTLTQAQVHHRDSYCGSELEYPHDYLESHRRRRSSSTQTTLSDLRQCLRSYGYISSSCSNASSQSQSNHSPAAANLHPGPYFTFNNVLSPRNSAKLSPPSGSPKVTHLANSVSPSPASPLLLSVSNFGQGRKRPSCKSLRKTTSLQCDE